tara:strand:+ start:380 stop:661 length:282 start_codon:yes stop_codon:yes gene_type:complete
MKTSALNKWFDTFLEEKGFDPKTIIEHQGKNQLHMIEAGHIMEFVKGLDTATKFQIKDKFVQIDFANGNYMHFIEYMAKAYVKVGEQYEAHSS